MPDAGRVFGRPSRTVVVGFPLCTAAELGHEDGCDGEVIRTQERYVPRILASLGFAKSVSEVKRNRPCLDFTVEPNTTHFVRFGRNLCYIVGGFDSEAERARFETENGIDRAGGE